jgi:hypothetical protein
MAGVHLSITVEVSNKVPAKDAKQAAGGLRNTTPLGTPTHPVVSAHPPGKAQDMFLYINIPGSP